MFGLGPTELVVILAVVVLLFGAKKIPELAKGVGRALVEFRKGVREPSSDSDEPNDESGRNSGNSAQ